MDDANTVYQAHISALVLVADGGNVRPAIVMQVYNSDNLGESIDVTVFHPSGSPYALKNVPHRTGAPTSASATWYWPQEEDE